MLGQILSALLPAIITIMLGYFAAWHHDFSQDEVPTLNRMVMTYALPLALFVGVFSAGREQLLSSLPLVCFLLLAIVGTYALVLLAAVFIFRHPIGLSALRALMASGPSTAFVGVPVLGSLYGDTASIPIAVGGMIIVIFLLPTTLVLLELDAARSEQALAGTDGAATAPPHRVDIPGTIMKSLKRPIVWLPSAGVVMVLLGVDLPQVVDQSLSLLGHSSSGVALFASGIILAGYNVKFSVPVLSLVFIKNVLQPALVCLGMLSLGYKDPILGQAVVTTALPAVSVVVMLAVQFRTAIPEAASALLISTFGSLLTISLFIWIIG
ncbi:AEC family transporter [Methyloceanibacter sp. wino2]|uniref:AEC family transporter n=1 Tax=Methyloceanibacter sp. wino2 TaxID=2170729 RepID=UPI000D3E10D9|nr:AEC family transporter [Methyloceanibacter sp. wino2]